jgi:ferritin-like metal-binding protein YciE
MKRRLQAVACHALIYLQNWRGRNFPDVGKTTYRDPGNSTNGIVFLSFKFHQKTIIMEKMNDLRALLKHDLVMLESAEKQIVEAMPAMIARATNPSLKQALQEHLRITETHVRRLEQVQERLGADDDSVKKYSGVLANLMGGTKCKGMDGLIDEGQKLMAENLDDEVMDAAIIGGSQKIEHFEIASYGTARAFAEQLGLNDVAQMLQQTLDEEYRADQLLTELAVNSVNLRAEMHA